MIEGEIFTTKAPFIYDKECGVYFHGMLKEEAGSGSVGFYIEDGCEGRAQYTVIKIVKMDRPYSDKVFYRKQLIDPKGRFGFLQPLQMCGVKAFENLISGKKWRYEVV